MTHQEFKQTYLNTYVERVDDRLIARNQCMDLAIAYCEEVLGTPRPIFAGLVSAYQIYEVPTENTGTRFDFIVNQKWAIPKQGDVIVFKKAINGGDGHVGIVDTANINSVTIISENDPISSKVTMKTYTYDYVAGWLRRIQNTVSGGEIEKLEKQITDLKATEEELKRQILGKDKQIQETSANYEGKMKDQAVIAQKMIDNAKEEYKKRINQLRDEVLFLVEKYKNG